MPYLGSAIMGQTTLRLAQLQAQTRQVNPNAPRVAELYLELGPRLGVRGDLAYAQALLETNYFRYGGVVRPEQNNYGGLGATGPDNPGAAFATPFDGVMAHLQHLFAYATTDPLPDGVTPVDPRFDLVVRGTAPHIGDLNGRWAVPGATYGQDIDAIFGAMAMQTVAGEPYTITNAFLDPTSQNRPGRCSDSGCWQGVQGIVVHRTADPGANARDIRNYFNNAPDGRFASSQFTLDDTEILQLMPIGEIAYHTAGKNYTHLGIETCEYNWGTSTWNETYRKLVWLTAYLARTYGLPISAVSGHFMWDPVNRPYDPTHLGWTPAEGKSAGLFRWEDFISDVQAAMTPPAASPALPAVPVSITIGQGAEAPCVDGVLIDDITYVPIRAYTACVAPDAQVEWIQDGRRVIVHLPGTTTGITAAAETTAATAADVAPGTAPGPGAKLTHKQYVARLKARR